jgi:hypothetical protein
MKLMPFVRIASTALVIAGALALGAVPASAAGPAIDVTPATAAPGTSVTFAITCGSSAPSATVFGTTLGLPEQIPMQASTHVGVFVTTVSLPASIRPGTYTPAIDCSNGTSGTATLVVNAVPATPSGVPLTGDGATSTTMGGPFGTAGIALVGLGVLLGVTAAFRRKRPGPGARG